MKMKNANTAAHLKEMAKRAVPSRRTLGIGGTIVAGGLIINACKGPEQVQISKKPVTEVAPRDISNYEIKDAKPGGSKSATPSPLGMSINNNGQPNNPETYYYVPSREEAGALYGKNRLKEAAAYEYRVSGISKFGEKDSINVGIVACNQLLEFLTNANIVDVSGGYARLVKYNGKHLFTKNHTGYATQSSYVINRTGYGLAGIWQNDRDSTQFALWVIPENKSTYSIKIPFGIRPEGDAAIKLDSNFFAYSSNGARQVQVAIVEETPVKPEASVRDFVRSTKNTSAFGYSDDQNIIYTPSNAIYASDTAVNYAIGREMMSKALGDTAIALGTVDIAKGCKVSDALGNVNRAGLGMIVTRTGVFATYYRLIKSDAKDSTQVFSAKRDDALVEFKQALTSNRLPKLKDDDAQSIFGLADGKVAEVYLNGTSYSVRRSGDKLALYESTSVVMLPLTKFVPGLEVLPSCNKDNSRQEVFNPVIGEGHGHFSFTTNVPGKKDTVELCIMRENDGDVINVKMGMAGVSRIVHSEKDGDIYITLWGADDISIVGQVIISKGVPYENIDRQNTLMKDGTTFNSQGMDAKTHKDMVRAGKALQQGFRPNAVFANRSHTGFANRNRV